MKQLTLPGFERDETLICPLCGQPAALFGQYSPFLPWGVCRACSLKYPYPDSIIVPSTRRNADRQPLMIDPAAPYELRARRMKLEEMLRCAVDPARLERPVVKLNLNGLEIHNPIRRSRMHQYTAWKRQTDVHLLHSQMRIPVCDRCGQPHNRLYETRPGQWDYWSTCQRCEDELRVEALYRCRGIFGGDDVESILDRLYRAHRPLFDRGVLPDYWFGLMKEMKT